MKFIIIKTDSIFFLVAINFLFSSPFRAADHRLERDLSFKSMWLTNEDAKGAQWIKKA